MLKFKIVTILQLSRHTLRKHSKNQSTNHDRTNQSHTLRYFWTITNVHSRAHPARILDSHTPRDGLAPAPVILSLRWAGSVVRTSLVFYFIFQHPNSLFFSEVHTLVDTTAHTHTTCRIIFYQIPIEKISLHSSGPRVIFHEIINQFTTIIH